MIFYCDCMDVGLGYIRFHLSGMRVHSAFSLHVYWLSNVGKTKSSNADSGITNFGNTNIDITNAGNTNIGNSVLVRVRVWNGLVHPLGGAQSQGTGCNPWWQLIGAGVSKF